ncbi:hypothetical protein HYW32_03105 [Candidatus Berkelbacteria bacterium]|nr:hypothetical protein [Candidatus Berkelbacteria bacterium]
MKKFAKYILESLLAWGAHRTIRVQKPLIIGITGSSGKTSTKDAIGHVLKYTLHDREINVAEGNLNTEFGLPLAVLGLSKPETKLTWLEAGINALLLGMSPVRTSRSPILVLEYGAEQPGDIHRLVKFARPDISVVTNIGEAHTAFLGSIEGVAKEKSWLVKALPKSGIAILNGDDKRVWAMREFTHSTVVKVIGKGQDFARSAALAVAEYGFGIQAKSARAALKSWEPPVGRLRLLKAVNGAWLLDDTYNANPLSTTLALSELGRLGREKKAKRLVAILGDMLELGSEEHRAHQGIALLGDRVADQLILVGPRFRRTKLGIWFPGPIPAAAFVLSQIQKGDLVLVKGSQSMRMEKVSESLLANQRESNQVLVRQTRYWKQKPYIAP